ncbi:Os06g0115700 [Oryza sativa Japonica Group]|uniref:Os06g0115700 protein n=3 Tax=Oryza sativa TaxID=4530 RepID=C7J352_ORYSJ|nr:hypothetical protein OsI_21384 [Oryza sativa Indica Group]EEE64984.1 hypothetical protein OsJ_19904 [Oryza sativa Japonica Group]BAD67909.1 unknown protein [Oryza sativa Japonica Group]BAH93298.1 Os06g0115700 [Oryza sativa Japonica Group]BAS95842.1 Os06g0115700 [Oryza sativa Japonica Group]|eukprot:NP_001174570.1 Os06g0115700 [Oryza sativa Japonica Group]
MVVALGPGRFYGSSLPRPRFFSGGDRVEPPVAVTDPLMAWAHEAHWSMGGLSSKRLRLQGRIEGSIDKLRRRGQEEAGEEAQRRVRPRRDHAGGGGQEAEARSNLYTGEDFTEEEGRRGGSHPGAGEGVTEGEGCCRGGYCCTGEGVAEEEGRGKEDIAEDEALREVACLM